MNLQWNIETLMILGGSIASGIGTIYILRFNWKQYGLLFLLSCVIGNILCLLFVVTHLYSYPYNIFPGLLPMPFTLLVTMFPFYVLFGVRYSPSAWKYKIPFYWVLVHIGVLGEVLAENFTKVIKYDGYWDTWDSYTWWWLFLLAFEAIGNAIVSPQYKKPFPDNVFQHGKPGWYILHFILILSVFLGGIYFAIRI